jgi:hypothetical protein
MAVFTLTSSSTHSLTEMAGSMTASMSSWFDSGSASASASSSKTAEDSNVDVSIKIRAFGIGLNMNGSDTFVARNMDDYFNAMRFAFKSMQNDEVFCHNSGTYCIRRFCVTPRTYYRLDWCKVSR